MAKLNTNFQHREAFTQNALQLREAEGEEPQKIGGVAIVTNAETTLYECDKWREIEVIDPSCIAQDIIDNSDIKLNLLHERKDTIARNNKGNGTLSLTTEEDGLHFEVALPNCDLGQRAAALIANGTYTGCSFEFYPQDYAVEEREGKDGKLEYVVRHTKFAAITAITIGMDPAYQQTSVGLREMYRETIIDEDGETPEEKAAKREAELKAEKDRQARAQERQRALDLAKA